MPRYLVAGGAGFLGSHLCDRLLERGEVVCIDDFSTGREPNLAHLAGNEHFSLLRHDITEALPDVGRLDAVFNLACPASPTAYFAMPLETLRVCSLGTERLIELALGDDARYFHASTSEVYGDPLVHPQPETYWGNVNPRGARSMYDEGKRYAEALVRVYQDQHGLDARIARIFNTYGPRMRPDDGRVVTNFVVQALRGEPLTVHGDGGQTRSFCYVDDEIEGFLNLYDSDLDIPVNVGNPHEFTMNELARIVLEITGSASPVRHLPGRDDDPQVRSPDIRLARTKLGWDPRVDLHDGLCLTIDSIAAEI